MAATQIDTLRCMTALRLHRPMWARALLLGVGLNDVGRMLALASLAAGAAALLLESDPVLLREAAREGCATFAVTTLDEALRALKNEVRQGRAITVALGGDTELCLREMVERGVLPQAVAAARALSLAETSSIATLQGWGAERLCVPGARESGSVDLGAVLHETVHGRWQIEEDIATDLAQRRAKDAALLGQETGDDPMSEIMQHWMRAAPTLFPRALNRACWKLQ